MLPLLFVKPQKGWPFWELIVSKSVQNETKRKDLLDLCQTHWAESHDAYRHSYQGFIFIVQALDVIGYHMHLTNFGDLYGDWDWANHSFGQQTLNSITKFDFIVVFLMMYQYLYYHMAGITVKLQGKAVDIIETYSMIASTKDTYTKEHTEVDKKMYDHAVKLSEKVGSSPSKPGKGMTLLLRECSC